ncbi:MAG: hypothetical protein CM1200mP9_07230 [Gammaproteobacteria bacterium]|nr:MAG: hypothetical protein CM1200mP9_07230 [Gammaproteobacteria bacterium]
MDSTRDIVKDILASPVPVAAYVSPEGARQRAPGLNRLRESCGRNGTGYDHWSALRSGGWRGNGAQHGT